MKEMTKDEAVRLYQSHWWEDASQEEIAKVQLFTERLVCPFSIFRGAIEATLGRPVWTHEFAFWDALRAELLGDKPAPSFEEILALLPEGKRVVVVTT